MKKKFVLTLALVLMVAVTLSAATALEVSGKASAGYTFEFGPGAAATANDKAAEATVNFKFAADTWAVELKSATYQAGKQGTATALLTIDLAAALASEGVDMGDVSLKLHAGTGVGRAAPTVVANVYDTGVWKKKAVQMDGTENFGLTIGYADLGTVYVSYDPVDGKSFVVGTKLAPVDGVDVAAGFTNDMAGENALGASAAVDIKKLADLDFGLKATVEYVATLSDPVASHLLADVAGSYEGISLWVAYRTDLTDHGVAARAAYATEVEGFDLSAGVTLASADVADFANTYGVDFDAGVSRKMGGVTYALDLGYALKGAFSVSPSVSVSF